MNNEIAERIQMIKEGKMPVGYEKYGDFEVPNDWDVLDLGKIMNFKNGLNYGKNDVGEEIKILGVGDFQKNFYLNTRELNKIKYSDLDENYLLENGDLVFVRSNGNKELIGRVLYCENIEEKVTYSGFTIRGRLDSNNFIDKYCAYYCSSNLVKKQYMKNGGGTNINNLSQDILSNVKITKPPIKEQEKIVSIISTFDRLIKLKEKLLQEKQKQKQGLIEKLLSGKVRVSGFDKEWKTIKLGSVVDTINKDALDNPKEYNLLTVKLHVKGIEATDKKPSATEKGRPYYLREPGELLIGRQNFHNGGIGIIPSDMKGYIASNAITSLKVIKGDLNFYFYYLSNQSFYKRVDSIIGGTGQKEISETMLKKLKITIPTQIEEQKQIANILRTADKELELLKKELEALKEQKKGLMQLLLTGIVRV